MKQEEIDKLAKKIWNYQELDQKLKKSDCILVLGCVDTRLANRAAELYLNGWAPVVLFSGSHGTFSGEDFDKSEAEIFSDIAVEQGVPDNKILIENKSTNTGENIKFSKELMQKEGYDIDRLMVVTTPFSERRAYAAFKKQWPEVKIVMSSPRIGFDNYPTEHLSKERMINTMVGDLQRIKVYPKKGFQVSQDIPAKVWEAYEKLVEQGYNKYLLGDDSD